MTQAGAGDFDEWITVGRDHYWNLGAWVGPITADLSRRERLNAFLRIDKVCTILSQFRIAAASTCYHEGTHYAALAYKVSPATKVPDLQAWIGDDLENRELDVHIWINLASGFPVKVMLAADQIDWRQAFIGFNEALEIEIPRSAAKLSRSEPDDMAQ